MSLRARALSELQQETNSALILITHDLGVVAEVCHDVLVMYGGQCVESGPVDEIFYDTRHPYTLGLLKSMPTLSSSAGKLNPIPGQPPSLFDLPKGCIFSARCQYAELVADGLCAKQRPELRVEEGHGTRCHLSGPQVITIRNSR